MDRHIDGPDWEWGTAEQCAKYLNLDKTAFLRLVKHKCVPPPGMRVNRQNTRWHWRVIVAVSELMPFLTEDLPPEAPPRGQRVKPES